MKTFAALAAVVLLAGCATHGGVPGVPAVAERADTDASLAYAGIAQSVNAYKLLPSTSPASATSAEGLKVKAWGLLQKERAVYASGIVPDITALEALVATAAKLGH